MIKSLVQSFTCEQCKRTIGEYAPIIPSKVMTGTYLTVCPHCMTPLMTAGQQLILMPNPTDNPIALKLEKELSEGMSALALDKIKTSDIPDEIKDVITDFLTALTENTEEIFDKLGEDISKDKIVREGNVIKFKNEPEMFTDSNNNQIIRVNIGDIMKDKLEDKSNSHAKAEEFNKDLHIDQTTHVVLVDGNVYDEYAADVTVEEIFKDMEIDHGIDAIVNGSVKLFELKEIKPKLKKKVTYELDM